MFNLTRTHKLVFLILIEFLLIYLLYMLKVTPYASGYEASIYAAYPDTFWVIYFLIYLFSLSAVVYSVFIKGDKLIFYSSLFNLLVLTSIILLLPFLRGYITTGIGDVTNHLAYLKSISSTHYWGGPEAMRNSPYPLPHILSVDMMLITQMKLETISLMFFFLIPMLLYALIRDVRKRYYLFRYIIVILALTLPLTHPASSLLLTIFLSVICLVILILPGKTFPLRNYINTVVLFLVVWLYWLISYLQFEFAGWIRYYIDWFSSPLEQASYFKKNVKGLEAAQLSLVDAATLYIKKFGPMHLLFGLASAFSIYSIYNWIKKKSDKLNVALSLICLVSIALYIISFFFTLTLLGARVSPYVLLIAILTSTAFLFALVNAFKTRIKKVASLTLTIILLFSMTYIAIFSFYDSPFTRDPPEHLTYMELNGMSWFLQTRNKNLEVDDLSHQQKFVATYLLGFAESDLEPNLTSVYVPITMPHHFNYDNESLLAKTLKKNMYLIINKKTELISTNLFPEYEDRWVFHPDDYEKLESDKSIDKTYHNGEIKIFFVNGGKYSEPG